MAIRLVGFGLISLRGSASVFRLFQHWYHRGFPCHVAIRSWIARFGLHQLQKAKEKRDDWVLILDHTIDFGAKKCLVVLGVTLESLRQRHFEIRHQDLAVLAVSIEEKADAPSVERTLERVSTEIGVPAQIVSDHGSNIKCGVERFIAKGELATRYTYDVTHKAAILLKYHLEADDAWQLFVKKACHTKRCVLHTALGYLSPPKPRDKARWLNLDSYMDWAERALAFGETPMPANEREKYDETMSWLVDFSVHLKEWRTMLDMLRMLKDELRKNGLGRHSATRFQQAALTLPLKTERLKILKRQIVDYLRSESAGIEDDQKWLGCSDIIESVIGKYKGFSAKTPMKEVGRAILTLPVFTTAVTLSEVKEAMETVTAKDVDVWLRQNIGTSLFAKRKEVYARLKTKSIVKKSKVDTPKAANF